MIGVLPVRADSYFNLPPPRLLGALLVSKRDPMETTATKVQRRNKCFGDTHNEMIETAVTLIADKGVESLSIVALAKAMGVNRTTVYYHFDSREKLVAEVKAWSSQQIAEAFSGERPRSERVEHIYRFVLKNPELLKMWLDDFLAEGDIRQMYPHWDGLVEGIKAQFSGTEMEHTFDAEVFCVNLLTSAFIGPRVFKNSVCPDADIEVVVDRFKAESLRTLSRLSLI